jgi:hypothetical protein
MDKLEATQKQHTFVIAVVDEIKKLKTPPSTPAKRRIGFRCSQPDDNLNAPPAVLS